MSAGIPVLGSVTLSGATSIQRKERDYIIEHQIAGKDGGLVERVGSASTRWEIKGFLREATADSDYQSLVALLGTTSNLSIPTFGSGYFLAASGTVVFVESFGGNWIPGYGYPRYDYNLKLVSTTFPASTIPNLPPIVLLQHVYADGTPANSGNLTFPNPTITGSTIICVFCVSSANNFNPTASCSDNNGNSYSLDVAVHPPLNSSGVFVASTVNVGPKASHQISAAWTSAGAGGIAMAIYEFTGFSPSSPAPDAESAINVGNLKTPTVGHVLQRITFFGGANGGSGVNTITTTPESDIDDGIITVTAGHAIGNGISGSQYTTVNGVSVFAYVTYG